MWRIVFSPAKKHKNIFFSNNLVLPDAIDLRPKEQLNQVKLYGIYVSIPIWSLNKKICYFTKKEDLPTMNRKFSFYLIDEPVRIKQIH